MTTDTGVILATPTLHYNIFYYVVLHQVMLYYAVVNYDVLYYAFILVYGAIFLSCYIAFYI